MYSATVKPQIENPKPMVSKLVEWLCRLPIRAYNNLQRRHRPSLETKNSNAYQLQLESISMISPILK
jgi:hypothetical protein